MAIWTGWLIGIATAAQMGAAQLNGRVVDEASGTPLAGATVSLADLGRHTRTSTDGQYAFPVVPAGPQHVVVRAMGYAPRSLHALVPGAGSLELDVRLTQTPQRLPTLTVAPEAEALLPQCTALTGSADRVLSRAALRESPLLMEPDAFLSLGGGWVRAAPESPDGLHVRGGSPDQVAYLLDGIPVFNPYHASGLFSGWNPDAVASVDLTSTQPHVWSPHTLSATVHGVLRSPSPRIDMQGSTTTTHSRFTTSGPIATSGSGFLLSGRTGYPGLLARAGDGSIQRGRTQDLLGMLELPSFGGRARLTGFASEDELDTQAFADLAGSAPLDSRRNNFEWGATSLGATWERGDRRVWKAAA